MDILFILSKTKLILLKILAEHYLKISIRFVNDHELHFG
jgi:hypothetical protein